MLTAVASALLSHLALQFPRGLRMPAMIVLALIALSAPFLVAADWRVTRFFLAVFSALMVFKIWELTRLHRAGFKLDWNAHWRFIANVFCLSIRASAHVPPQSLRHIVWGMLRALGWMTLSVLLLSALQRLHSGATPFWFHHLVVVVALMIFVIFELDLYVFVTRLCGGRIIDANNRPWRAVTPADFWRRYNRIIGQFLHDNVFRPLHGADRPVCALMAVFAVSGLLHEYVFWLAIERAAGLQMLFFLLQGAAVALTARIKPRGRAIIGWRLGTWLFMALSSAIFFVSFDLMLPVYPGKSPADWVSW